MFKDVVTHYFALEIRMALFMNPCYGVEGRNATFEFAKTHGAIYFHLTSALGHDEIYHVNSF